jgi:hypothetical protein
MDLSNLGKFSSKNYTVCSQMLTVVVFDDMQPRQMFAVVTLGSLTSTVRRNGINDVDHPRGSAHTVLCCD